MKSGLKKTVVTGVAAIVVVGSLAGAIAASAKTGHKMKPAVEKVAAVDTDNIQSGDQTSPDAAKGTSENSGESSNENGGEAGGTTDGPGGWQDPAGENVNNEQSGPN